MPRQDSNGNWVMTDEERREIRDNDPRYIEKFAPTPAATPKEKVSERKSDDTVFTERKLKASAATDPVTGGGDQGFELTELDEEILDRAWERVNS